MSITDSEMQAAIDERGWEWRCPHSDCGCINFDVPDLTAVPMCECCVRNVHWDEIEEQDNA